MENVRPNSAVDPEEEYKAIERTLLESPRGRWFLSEHGRRARRLDSLTLHEAINKLQHSLREPPALLGQLRNEIESLQDLLRETRGALTARQTTTQATTAQAAAPIADGAGDAATPTPASATHILSVAEAIHELAWDLQAQDVNVNACVKIARQASQMYALSHRHAVESERVRGLTEALDGALLRLDGLLETVALETQFDTYNPVPDDDAPLSAPPMDSDAAAPTDQSNSDADDDLPPLTG